MILQRLWPCEGSRP